MKLLQIRRIFNERFANELVIFLEERRIEFVLLTVLVYSD